MGTGGLKKEDVKGKGNLIIPPLSVIDSEPFCPFPVDPEVHVHYVICIYYLKHTENFLFSLRGPLMKVK